MKKRILSILLTLCMVLCLVPITVFAAGGAKAILPGTSAQSILKIDKSRLSFAGHEWWVIGQKTDKSNNAPIITLLAVNNDFGDVPFRTGSAVPFENASRYSEDNGYYANNPSDMSQWRKPNEYAGSTLQQKMVSLAEAIPEKEQAVIRPKDITKGITGQEVKAQKLWALSQEDSIYLYRNSCKYAAKWWTRSSNEVYGYGSWTIHPDGRSGSALNVDYDAAVRPAMELDLSSVLFISAAEHGKVADLTTPIAEYAGDEWKLTLHDSDRDDFTAKTVLVNGSVLEVEYKNAKVGDNEYISAVIKDADGSISRYTRVVQLDGTTNGTRGRAAIDLTGIDMTGKTLCVFNEQFNGDHKTDYAGALREVKLTDEIDEQFTLAPGGRYYFDLSAMNIPGTANSNLPDKTLHYVPFTYVGTVDAYSMENETDTAKQPYEHSLFIADYNVKCSLQRETLAEMNLIYGQTYTASNVNYTLRAPSVGDHHRNEGEGSGLAPIDNEWDTIYQKSADYIKNWYKMRSFGQDIGTGVNVEGMYLSRGGDFAAKATFWARPTLPERDIGFRPVLELPTDLAADSLKIVELLTGEFMPGEQQNWINIIVKNGESFTAPSAEGLPRPDGISADAQLWWVDENSNFYKPGDTVPADVSALTALWGGFGLFLDRGDGEVEVTPDNYTDIFGDGTASFVLPKGKNFSTLRDSVNLTGKDILEIYSTGRLERYGSVFPNLKLKNADLTSVRLSEEYIGDQSPLFVTLDGKNTIGSLTGIIESNNTLSVIGDGSLTLNSALTLEQYTQYGGGSVTMTDGLTAYDLTIDSGSLTVTGDPQAITLRNQDIGYLEMGDGARLFTGSSAQDATEAAVPQLSAEMQEVYQRYLAEDSTLTNEEISALSNALRERFNAIFRQLPGKTYVRITGAWDVTYQPGTNGSGNAVTDIKFYNDALTLRGALFTRTGHTQVGWATVDGGEKVYGLDDIYTKNEALTLYPVWNTNKYTITFDTNGGSEIAPVTQDYGTAITAPADPTREGYTFIGWDREIPTTMPAENMIITAKWKVNQYTITFDSNGGSEIAPITQDYGTNIAAPADPTREGYTFIGWDKAIPATMPAENMIITAKWKVNQYTITFDSNGGSEIAPITQDYGTAIVSPADPTREGYTFIGWDMEIPTTMPAENITLKAKWKDIEKPTGEIKISENSWKAFLNNITFGLFFKDTQTVTINASDNSGTVFISYLVTDRDLSETELGSLVYRAYEEPFRIDPNGEYIVYAMLVDESLNITYLRSDRVTLDNVQPVISGIEDGKTYCEAQTVTVDEKYVDTVTVNGTAVTLDESGSFVLSPADGGQRIVVTDKAGNTAEMTVTVNNGHTYGEWQSNGDGTHTRKCTVGGCTGSETKDCSGGKATCKDKAVCEVCGKAYGELDPKNHTALKHIPAKAATEGNIEYWYCSGCNKYYSDKDGTKEIAKADTVTAKLPKSPPTGDNSSLVLWIALLLASGGAVIGTAVVSKKKKHSAE
ncbi:MAG: InlB B-repeat-containing protein [Firmicutes bacterium]|nr:InlB B-repeat-containing protein [Bacillota bacterium]